MDWIKLFLSLFGRIGRRLYGIAMAAVIATQILSPLSAS
ncbi:uncharacterized membrane protein YhaH (DUF805 family) [Asticcacaulis solisilvae]|nr:uncharacterized membrane protein YhaH (DUF805 family) [Asticcacaulis solisilvae]MDR6802939.1 uncharacterized membrane protein YhaH (DUF805 family) [Asticcacaulis sp. BE141]